MDITIGTELIIIGYQQDIIRPTTFGQEVIIDIMDIDIGIDDDDLTGPYYENSYIEDAADSYMESQSTYHAIYSKNKLEILFSYELTSTLIKTSKYIIYCDNQQIFISDIFYTKLFNSKEFQASFFISKYNDFVSDILKEYQNIKNLSITSEEEVNNKVDRLFVLKTFI